jgi:hypothetical protein
MRKSGKTSGAWVLFLAAALWTGAALAQAGPAPFYLLARTAPEGSITAAGQQRQLVYLRWDVVEGGLPLDLARIELLRDGELLLDQPVEAVMSAVEIAALYQGPAQARRLQETLTLLREAAAQSGGSSITAGVFAEVIRARIDPAAVAEDRVWAYQASRTDFNIARARYRAFLDAPGAGAFSYELRGVSTGGQRQRLGLVTVNTTVPTVLQGSTGFSQFREDQVRCDLPEAARDHHVVSLAWDRPGANETDAFAANLYLAGFDLYRTTANVAPELSAADVARNLAAEAAAAGFDARGNPELPGLQRVNDAPINDPGGAARGPKWIETPAELARAGVRPGDRRAYYLVARDFTGNYGPTEVAVVEVPNLTRPPPPWSIRPFADQTGGMLRAGENLTLRWEAVNLDNYLATFNSTRRACNLAEARATGVLEFVGPDEDCATDPRRRARLDVAGYAIYRFPDFGSAEQFRDSDGDGVDDFVERPDGMQCDIERQPAGAASNLVWPAQVQEFALDSGRQVVRFVDQVPAGDKGRVYWYRVASYTPDGRFSHLSAPVRGLFPDRELPEPPVVNARRPDNVPNGCRANVTRTEGPWNFEIAFADAGRTFDLACGGIAQGSYTADRLGESCEKIAVDCAGLPVSFSYPAVEDTGGQACEAEIPTEVPFCAAGEVIIEPRFEPGMVPVATGEVTAGPVEIEVTAPNPDTCVSLFQEIDGDHARVATSCGTIDAATIFTVPAGYFCGYAVSQDANNNVSVAESTPCVLVTGELKPPGMPQLLDFDVTPNAAQLRWRLPVEPLAAVLVRLEHEPAEGDPVSEVFSVPVAGFGAGDPVNHVRTVAGLAGEVDRWCVSLRSIGVHGLEQQARVSEWTPRRCVSRAELAETPPVYLPWPSVPGPVERAPLTAGATLLPLLYLSSIDLSTYQVQVPQSDAVRAIGGDDALQLLGSQPLYAIELGRLDGLDSEESCLYDRSVITGYPPLPTMLCTTAGRLRVDAALAPASGFLVYRQSRGTDGTLGDWLQVSPLIEFAHWDRVEPDEKFPANARLNDPYLKLVPAPGQPNTWRILFFDRFPQMSGLGVVFGESRDYRYQLVYFDERQRPVAWRQSAWLGSSAEGQ